MNNVLTKKPIPIFIIAYNNLTFVRNFVEQISKLTDHIVIVDNKSTYPQMFHFYDFLEREMNGKVIVHRLNQNYGAQVYKLRPDLFPDVFVISDPDLLLNEKMPVNCCAELLAISNIFQVHKVGLALDISKREKFIQGSYGELVYGIESNYWKNRIPSTSHVMYEAPIDTTFTIVNKNYADDGTHIRVAGDFTCEHLPWYEGYLKDNIAPIELSYWKQNNNSSSILNFHDPSK